MCLMLLAFFFVNDANNFHFSGEYIARAAASTGVQVRCRGWLTGTRAISEISEATATARELDGP